MDAHERTVDHLHLAVVGRDDGIHQPIPDAGLAPAIEAIVDGRVRPISFRQVAPGRPCPQDPEDAAEDAAIVLWLAAATARRKNRLDNAPLEIRQVVAHDPSSDVSQLESPFAPIR